MIDVNQAYNFIVDNEICTEAEAELVTSINGYNIEAINDIIYCRTGYHDIEQLHDCEPYGLDFSMIDGLEEDEDDDEEGKLTAQKAANHVENGGRITIESKGNIWGCDFYKKNNTVYAYNSQVMECDHNKDFNLLEHLQGLEADGFRIIKSDDLTLAERDTLHNGDIKK